MILRRIFNFYIEGFKSMSKSSKMLWTIIIIKLVIMFAVLRVFFFKNYLNSRFDNDKDKSEYVSKELTKIKK